MKTFFQNFLKNESGASAAEYALIIAIVGVGIGAAALSLGANVEEAVGNASNEVYNCNNATGTVGTYDTATSDCSSSSTSTSTSTGG